MAASTLPGGARAPGASAAAAQDAGEEAGRLVGRRPERRAAGGRGSAEQEEEKEGVLLLQHQNLPGVRVRPDAGAGHGGRLPGESPRQLRRAAPSPAAGRRGAGTRGRDLRPAWRWRVVQRLLLPGSREPAGGPRMRAAAGGGLGEGARGGAAAGRWARDLPSPPGKCGRRASSGAPRGEEGVGGLR